MYNKKYTIIFTICLVSLWSLSLRAQDEGIDKKKYSEELLKIYNPWMATQNTSGLYHFADQESISELYASFNNITGDFARTMDASNVNTYSVGSYSYQKYKNIGLFGKFEYQNSYEDNVNWCDVMNPYSGNPFILGDENGGDYHKELFHMEGGMSSTLFGEKSIWGIGVEYISSTGGKDNDPRPLNKLMKAEIKPGLLFTINNFRLGFNFNYSFTKEEINMKSFVDNESYILYQFRGLGLYTFDNVSSFNRNYFSNRYGGNIQLGFNIGDIENITEAGFFYKKENVEDGSSTIKDFGYYEEELMSLKSSFILKKEDFIHKFVISGEVYDRMGAINILRNEADGFTYVWNKYGENRDYTQKSTNIALNYSLYKMNSKYAQDWKADIKLEYFDNNTQYKFDPDVFEEDYQGLDFKVALTKNFSLDENSLISINLYSGYNFNLDKNLYILSDSNKDALLIDNIDDFIIDDVVLMDYEWSTSNVFKAGGYFKYAVDIKAKNTTNSAYLKLAADYFNTDNEIFDGKSRTYLSASIGLLF